MTNYWLRRHDMRVLIREMLEQMKLLSANGVPIERCDFKPLLDKYPRVNVDAKRLIKHIKEKFGVG